MLKESARTVQRPAGELYDLVYCAGLFDYLSDQVCKKLMIILHGLVAPGGLLIATNVCDALNDRRPFRYSMEYFLDWHLIYRDARRFGELKPDNARSEDVSVISDETGVNLFIEIRKPSHA